MARSVRAQVAKEEEAAAYKLATDHSITLNIPRREVVIPTTPISRDNIMKNPVAMFPNGK